MRKIFFGNYINFLQSCPRSILLETKQIKWKLVKPSFRTWKSFSTFFLLLRAENQFILYIAVREIMSLLETWLTLFNLGCNIDNANLIKKKKEIYIRRKVKQKFQEHRILFFFFFSSNETRIRSKRDRRRMEEEIIEGRRRRRSFETWETCFWQSLFDDRRRSPRFNFSIRADSYRE